MSIETVKFSMRQWKADMTGARGQYIQRMAVEAALGLCVAVIAVVCLTALLVAAWRLL